MKKKIIPVLIAIVLIIVIGGVSFGIKFTERYSYTKERADLNAYFGMGGERDTAIILQDELIEERGLLAEGTYYVELSTAHKYFNDRFYEDKKEGLLLYTLPDDVIRNEIGSGQVTSKDGSETLPYIPARYEGEKLYIALDYVKRYANFSYESFAEPNRLQIYTQWDEKQVAEISKDTAVRILGGVKSEILKDVSVGEKVTVLERMETWSKVKTEDAVIGYVENKRLSESRSELPIPVTDYTEPEYTSLTRDHKVSCYRFYDGKGEK